MKERQKKLYESPTTAIVWLNVRFPLLAGSGDSIDGYGDADDNPWHFD